MALRTRLGIVAVTLSLVGCRGASINIDAGSASDGATDAGPCGVSAVECEGSCVDVSSSNANCGACGVACAAGQGCLAGTCVETCAGGSGRVCDGGCVNPQSDQLNCGACGHACLSGAACQSGACITTCAPPLAACASSDAGYCADLEGDPANCGACGNVCASGVCASGACTKTCAQTGGTFCSGVCVQLGSDDDNCGSCGRRCALGRECRFGFCEASACPGLANLGGLPALQESTRVGAFPTVTGDIDGDGLLDIIDDTGGPPFEIRLGVGGGRFGPPIPTTPTGGMVGWLVAAPDLNGDGFGDLVLSTGVWLGDGDGGFTRPTTSFPALAIGDFNKDGIADLVGGTSGLAVAYGNGDGTFSTPVSGPTTDSTVQVGVADFDGDGWPDLFFNHFGQIEIWVNQHDAGFALGPGWTGATGWAEEFAAVDLNGDGRADLATVSVLGAALDLWLQQPDGGLALANSVPVDGEVYTASLRTPGILTPDLNGDGVADIVACTAASPGAEAIVLLSGDGGFGPPAVYYGGNTDSLVGPLTFAGDFDGDGHVDLGIVPGKSAEISLLRNRGDGTLLGSTALLTSVGDCSSDWDGDGVGDCVASQSSGTTVTYGSLNRAFAVGTSCPDGVDGQTLADIDLDGLPDLLGFVGSTLTIGLNPGLRGCPSFAGQGFQGAGAIVVADFDGDGRRGIAVVDPTASTVTYLSGSPDSGFSAVATFAAANNPIAAWAADFDGDGRADLILQNYSTPPSILLRMDGGALGEVPLAGAPPQYGNPGIAVGDLNGDRFPDIVVSGAPTGVLVYLNDGKGGFGAPVTYDDVPLPGQLGQQTSDLHLADVDGDGALDIVARANFTWLATVRNRGDGTFEPAQLWAPGGGPVFAGDFDGDGRLDLMASIYAGFPWVTPLWNSCQP